MARKLNAITLALGSYILLSNIIVVSSAAVAEESSQYDAAASDGGYSRGFLLDRRLDLTKRQNVKKKKRATEKVHDERVELTEKQLKQNKKAAMRGGRPKNNMSMDTTDTSNSRFRTPELGGDFPLENNPAPTTKKKKKMTRGRNKKSDDAGEEYDRFGIPGTSTKDNENNEEEVNDRFGSQINEKHRIKQQKKMNRQKKRGGGAKSGKSSPTHSSKSSKAATPAPTTASPTGSPSWVPTYYPTKEPSMENPTTSPSWVPTYYPTKEPSYVPTYYPSKEPSTDDTKEPSTTTVAPTSSPPGAEYYTSFERPDFPDLYHEWSVFEPVKGRRLQSSESWHQSTDEAVNGVFSIKSPDLANPEGTPLIGAVNLITDPTWHAGHLFFSIKTSMNFAWPYDEVAWYVDDELRGFVRDPVLDFERKEIFLEGGRSHAVTFFYLYNTLNRPNPPLRGGTAYIDDVFFLREAILDGVSYYRGFERGDFPFQFEETDPEWVTFSPEDQLWEVTDERSNFGERSIGSPMIENEAANPGTASVGLSITDSFGEGTLFFSVLASVQMPVDQLEWYLDGVQQGPITDPLNEFNRVAIFLDEGPHFVEFRYSYNPLGFAPEGLPPDGALPNRTGEVFLDDVYFIPVVPEPPCENWLDPNPDSFETGTFPSLLWTTGGDGVWEVSNDKAYDGTTSLRSPVLESEGAPLTVSNSTLQICEEFPGGMLRFQVIASVHPLHDIFILYIDGEPRAQLVNVTEWIPVAVGLDPGKHRIDFSYRYNPFNADLTNVTSPPSREGAVWLDVVEIETLGTFES